MLFSKKLNNIFSFITVMVCLLVCISFLSSDVPTKEVIKESASKNILFKLRKNKFIACMKEAANIYYDKTEKFFAELSTCMKAHIRIPDSQLEFIANNVNGEKKVYLPMSEDYSQTECKWLTFGIGGSSVAEAYVIAKYPNCLVYGVDPEFFGNFSKVGTVLPFGVDFKDIKSQRMSFIRVLDEFVHSRLVHYLSADIEGFEMVLLSELVGFGRYANDNITFCQIDIEMHSPTQDGVHPLATKINRVQWMLDFLVLSSPYIPIYTTPYNPAHKVTFINFVNPECEKAFKISSYFMED